MSRATGLRHVIFITITPDCHECSRESYGIPQMGSEEFPHSPADGEIEQGYTARRLNGAARAL